MVGQQARGVAGDERGRFRRPQESMGTCPPGRGAHQAADEARHPRGGKWRDRGASHAFGREIRLDRDRRPAPHGASRGGRRGGPARGEEALIAPILGIVTRRPSGEALGRRPERSAPPRAVRARAWRSQHPPVRHGPGRAPRQRTRIAIAAQPFTHTTPQEASGGREGVEGSRSELSDRIQRRDGSRMDGSSGSGRISTWRTSDSSTPRSAAGRLNIASASVPEGDHRTARSAGPAWWPRCTRAERSSRASTRRSRPRCRRRSCASGQAPDGERLRRRRTRGGFRGSRAWRSSASARGARRRRVGYRSGA